VSELDESLVCEAVDTFSFSDDADVDAATSLGFSSDEDFATDFSLEDDELDEDLRFSDFFSFSSLSLSAFSFSCSHG
jgi:hypothetical protein